MKGGQRHAIAAVTFVGIILAIVTAKLGWRQVQLEGELQGLRGQLEARRTAERPASQRENSQAGASVFGAAPAAAPAPMRISEFVEERVAGLEEVLHGQAEVAASVEGELARWEAKQRREREMQAVREGMKRIVETSAAKRATGGNADSDAVALGEIFDLIRKADLKP